jgi:hypothetical protein
LLFAGEKLLESRMVSNRIPHRIDFQLLNRNVKAYRERKVVAIAVDAPLTEASTPAIAAIRLWSIGLAAI